MPYKTMQAAVNLQCETCINATCFFHDNLSGALQEAREQGWRLATPYQNGRVQIGSCLCPVCNNRRGQNKHYPPTSRCP